jgi:hypothetical protein
MMAITRPIRSAAHIAGAGLVSEGVWTAEFLLNANFYLSFDVITLPQSDVLLRPGDFVAADGSKAAAPGDILGISLHASNPSDGPVDAVLVTRHAEVVDAYLFYDDLDPAAVNQALAEHGIIVRAAVVSSLIAHGFGTPGTPVEGVPGPGIVTAAAEVEPAPPDEATTTRHRGGRDA